MQITGTMKDRVKVSKFLVVIVVELMVNNLSSPSKQELGVNDVTVVGVISVGGVEVGPKLEVRSTENNKNDNMKYLEVFTHFLIADNEILSERGQLKCIILNECEFVNIKLIPFAVSFSAR